MSEIKLSRQAADGARAATILEDPVVSEAFEELQRQYFEAWKASGPDEKDARERLWTACAIVGKVREHLEEVVSSGKLAQRQLDQIRATPSAYGSADS